MFKFKFSVDWPWTMVALVFLLAACAPLSGNVENLYRSKATEIKTPQQYVFLNRITWGANASTVRQFEKSGQSTWLQQQLYSPDSALPEPAQTMVNSMTIAQTPVAELVLKLEQQRKDADSITDEAQKKSAQQAYQQELNRLSREASTRHILRALYSPAQIQEQMTWFWLNHFNVFLNKHNLRAMVGDFEHNALRAHALGRFKEVLGAASMHPAMLRYLDNEQNANGRLNENFARELMELHTLGVGGGYTQKDVQELARVLTGLGVNMTSNKPNLRPHMSHLYVRRGLMEFNPQRHDMGTKVLLGRTVQGEGISEIENALDVLARHPATAEMISRKLATFWLSDNPPKVLIDRMVKTWNMTDGQINKVLETLLTSPEFTQAPPAKFKDPMRYVLSVLRLTYDDKVILNAGPVLNWINRMGEPLYGRQTPDGYSLVASGWDSAGQMTTRFEIAKAIGSGSAGLFKTEGPQGTEKPAFPQLANALFYQSIQATLGPATLSALEQATSAQEWNTFFLSSPEIMRR